MSQLNPIYLILTQFTLFQPILSFDFQELSQVCLDGEAREVLKKIQQQVDVVKQTAERISSSAEVKDLVFLAF